MVDSLRADTPRYAAISCDKSHNTNTAGSSFVDDTGLATTNTRKSEEPLPGLDSSEITEATNRLQLLAQHWEKLLFSTGGAIKFQKSAWFIMAWKWTNGHAKLVTNKEVASDLLLTEGNNAHAAKVPQLENTASFKTLGAYISPSGSNKVARQNLQQKSMEFGKKINSSFLWRQDAYWACSLYFIPQIGYSLPVMTFSQEDCTFIQTPALCAILSKLHLNKNTVFGPAQFGGLSIPALYTLQGVGQLHLLVHHLSARDEISSFIVIDLSYVQLLTGSTALFFQLPYSQYAKWMECGWVYSIWEFVSTFKLDLSIRQAFAPKLQREHNKAIMNVFLQLHLPYRQLAILNICCCFLQVITISDITTADGTSITTSAICGTLGNDWVSSLLWPKQSRPPEHAWCLWRNSLVTLETYGKLTQPLGKWINPTHQQWKWYKQPLPPLHTNV
jgi:hypothetical protein